MADALLASRYRLQARLGHGGMGVVHAALDEKTGARVAIELVHAEVVRDGASTGDASHDTNSRLTRFFREAKASAGIEGEHVARTLDWGTDEATGQAFIVMELLEGEDLQGALKRVHVLSPDVALRIASQACKGLRAAHQARVTHRDIKPANIFLARQASGEVVVKILDFGIAKVRPETESDGETTGLTRTGNMLGSPKYMSPEQARSSRALDHRTDLWSLGVVLFRALTGSTPHEEVTAIGEFIIVLCTEPAEPVQRLAAWVPPEIAEIVETALRINVDERYASAEEMLAAIGALLPNGDALRASDIATFEESGRRSVAPKATSSRPGSTGSGSRSGSRSGSKSPESTTAPSSLEPSASSSGGARKDDTASQNTTANTQGEAAGQRRQKTVFAVAGAAAVTLGALVFRLSRGAPSTSENGATSPGGAPSAAASASVSAIRGANVVILPGDAQVDVDGAPAPPADGVVKIVGELGSTHRVRLRKDGQEKITDVIIGPSGAEPPKVELVMSTAAAPSVTPKANGSAAAGTKKPGVNGAPGTKDTAAPSTSGHAPPPRNPLIPERFE